MGLNHEQLQQASHKHLLLHFARNGAFGPGRDELLVLERGEGPYVYDTRGRRYVDGLSSLFCCQIGYSYASEMAEAVSKQMHALSFNTNWATAHPPGIELAERLASLAPAGLEKIFFTSGGSEAVEAAWKIVRQYHLANDEPQRTKVISREVAYHGVTLGALSFTAVARFKDPFGPPAIKTRHVSNTNVFRSDKSAEELTELLLRELEQTIEEEDPDTVAMLIAEPIQNAGGCLVPPPGYWAGLRDICDRFGVVLVADEVISGFGRVGEWFASMRYGGEPDLITVAKGLTSGYAPMGAVLVSDRIAEPLLRPKQALLHGITFGGHPVAAAVALKNIEIFERDGILDNVQDLAPYLHEKLEGEILPLPIVGDVRGDGFFWAAELVKDAGNTRFDADEREDLVRSYLPRRILEAGLIARPDDRGDSVLQIAPPLISNESVLDEIVDALKAVLMDAATHMGIA